MDFVTHSHSALVERLGGIPDRVEVLEGPLVTVVVRTKDRPELLAEALASISDSTYRRVEVVLVNDGGESPIAAASFPFPVVRVEMGTNQGRAAAANAGVEAASGDYVCFLDDDDLMAAEHLETLVGLVTAAGVRVAYTDAAVAVYELDGDNGWAEIERRVPYSRDFDPKLLLVDNYIPFNTLIVERSLFGEAGPFDPDLEFFEDWDYLIRLSGVTPFHHLASVTAEYRHFRGSGHHILGETPRRRDDFLRMKATVISRHRDRLSDTDLAQVVDGLRAETVTASEEVAAVRRELGEQRRSLAEFTEMYHQVNGERDALLREKSVHLTEIERLNDALSEHRRAATELETETSRLRGEDASLRAKVTEQEEHLGRLYAEIDRLNSLIDAMEKTSAWRWHRRLEKLRGRS
jgi:hypothetical protein